MMPVLDAILACSHCDGQGWVEVRPGLSRTCLCRARPMEAA